jgi:hypothetical protein
MSYQSLVSSQSQRLRHGRASGRRDRDGAPVILGFLFFFVSHGLLHWAEQKCLSDVAALVFAIEPAIVALFSAAEA